MKIAFASDDGKSIAAHFGHSVCFLVLTVENGKVVRSELRNAGERASRHEHPHGHNEGDSCQCLTKPVQGHPDRLLLLRDCEAVMSLGMGPRAAKALRAAGIKPVVLHEAMKPEGAALAYALGGLEGNISAGACCSHDSH
jgi:predicted Fe-Mo cluster-binding NifX family protein